MTETAMPPDPPTPPSRPAPMRSMADIMGVPDIRRPVYSNQINLGALLQAGVVALSVIGSAVGAIFAAGGYVQHIRDDLASAQTTRAAEVKSTAAADQVLLNQIRQVVAATAATAAATTVTATASVVTAAAIAPDVAAHALPKVGP